jgi:hypothetical protein
MTEKDFIKANHLLGHFCRATGYDPTGSVTHHLGELIDLLKSGATAFEIHRMIDTFAGNLPGESGALFDDFINEFWEGRVEVPVPGVHARTLIDFVSNT